MEFLPKITCTRWQRFPKCCQQSIDQLASVVSKQGPPWAEVALILSYYASKTVRTQVALWTLLLISTRFYNAHETTAAEEFAIALLCGDVRCDVSFFSFHIGLYWQSPDVRWSIYHRRQSCSLRCLRLENHARRQDTPCQVTRHHDTIFQDSRETPHYATAEMDGRLAKDLLSGVQG